MLTYTTSYCVI